jgi:hypothetical protein
MDTRYLISNSKDQSIKLWDMRRFSNESTIEMSRAVSNSLNNGWDYRYEIYGRRRTNLFEYFHQYFLLFFFIQRKMMKYLVIPVFVPITVIVLPTH